jgi:membrane protein CcdC involved in cytochrome C biogenesis
MSAAQQGQLVTLAVLTVLIGLVMARRMRPQPVQPQRIAISGVIIVIVIGASLLGTTGRRVIQNPVSLALIPVLVALGIGLGFVLVRTMTFWVDQPTGQLWMKGGFLFAAILVGTIVLRFGISYIVYGSAFGGSSGTVAPTTSSPLGWLSDISADLLFLSLGLWVSRAFFLVQRYRGSEAGSPPGSVSR